MAIPLERLSVQGQLSQNLKASGKRNVYLAFHNWPQLWHPFGSPNFWNIFYFFNPSFSCPLPISVNILGFREMKLLWLMASQLVLVVFLQNRNCRQRLPNFCYLPKKSCGGREITNIKQSIYTALLSSEIHIEKQKKIYNNSDASS